MEKGKEVRVNVESETFNNSESDKKIIILWCDISKLSPTKQFCICCTGVFLFYLLYGYLLELIFTVEGSKQYGWYLTLMQFGYYAIFGWTEKLFLGFRQRRIPFRIYVVLAGLTLGTMGFSNTSLQYLNYPVQVIFKCCKLIPVLIGGILIQKKKYGTLDFLAAFSMCIGLAWFTLAGSYTSPNFNFFGIMMISAALVCDAVIGNVQEKVMKKYSASNTEVVYYSYALGFVYLLIILISNGQFFKGFTFCLHNPVQTYGYGLLFSASGYLGIQIILTLVKTCGALVAATVTTCRKAMSIVLSFIFFSKPFTIYYFWSGLLVLLGIYLNILAKNKINFSVKDFIAKDVLSVFKCYSYKSGFSAKKRKTDCYATV